MTISRRDFLKSSAAVVAAATVPVGTMAAIVAPEGWVHYHAQSRVGERMLNDEKAIKQIYKALHKSLAESMKRNGHQIAEEPKKEIAYDASHGDYIVTVHVLMS